jgi:DNA-binding NarL/FixJ family response regulator
MAQGHGALRVLVADDVADVRFLVRLTLEQDGRCQVVGEATHGEESVDLAESHRPDLVLLDIAMPVMDGLEAIPKIRAVSPESRILCYSGFEPEMGARALAACADAFMEKGRPAREIPERIVEVCSSPEKGCEGS